MSTVVMSACWPLQMPPTAKAVLVSLADNANDHGECWPSLKTISERTCFSERAVQNAISWLEACGVLTADRRNGRHTRYAITPEKHHDPRTCCTPAGDSPPQEMPKPPQQVRQPPQQVPSNRKEPSRTVNSSNKPALDFTSWPSEPSPDVLADWLALRKRKKADVSPTVLKRMGKVLHEAESVGYTVDDCLSIAVTRGWTGIEVSWLEPKNATRGNSRGGSSPQHGKTMGAILTLEEMKNGLADAGSGNGNAALALPEPGRPAGR